MKNSQERSNRNRTHTLLNRILHFAATSLTNACRDSDTTPTIVLQAQSQPNGKAVVTE